MHATDVQIVELTIEEVLGRRPELARLWPEASRDRIDEILPRHAARDGFRFLGGFDADGPLVGFVYGFRFLGGFDADGPLVGFVYGYRGAPGQWWHDRVARALGRSGSRRWLPKGHFEFTELHVDPERRRRGIGGALHDAIFELVDAPTAVLSTQTDNDPAIALYEGRDWEVIVPYLDFGSGRPFLIMGRDLR